MLSACGMVLKVFILDSSRKLALHERYEAAQVRAPGACPGCVPQVRANDALSL